ncbi:hypothetical protein KDA08_02520 [Candidatus Saccharibacteria bacterium]|nr:hypothetical protein [Candidatus Saccharibacteria bacterium]
MADIKSSLKAILDTKSYTANNKIYNSTEDAISNLERLVFDNYAAAIGDMRMERDVLRPKGFVKSRIFVDLLLFIKKNDPHIEVEDTQESISVLLYNNPSSIENCSFIHVNDWTEEVRYNDNISYTIATVEILRFLP